MLLPEHVIAQRRGGSLVLRAFDAGARARAEKIASELVAIAKSHVGASRGELEAALASADVDARDVKVKAGIAKLVLDRCAFDAEPEWLARVGSPEALRAEIFRRATIERREHGHVDRVRLIAESATAHGVATDALERALYADLKASHPVVAAPDFAPRALADAFGRGQAQAVLLRAERVVARVTCSSPSALRAIFRALKFHQLLFTAMRDGDAHVIGIDGPLSLFASGTKYGPRLAMVLPALEACDSLALEAIVRWGKERTRLVFKHEHHATNVAHEEAPLPDEVESLRAALVHGGFGVRTKRSDAILTLPGVGTCVPDLELTDARGRVCYVEVLGFWSREAVWRRVELAQRGLGARVVFCVSSRLRVSEEVLPEELPSALYVYKGALSARAVADRAKTLFERDVG